MNRLLSINSYHYRRGGADIVYLEHAAMFAESGWSTAFFAMHHPKNIATPWSRYFVDEVELRGEYSTLQKISKGTKAVYSFEAKRRIADLVREFKPTIAHVHNVYHHLSPSIFATLKELGIPLVLTAHDLKIACPSYRMLSGDRICEKCKSGNLLNPVFERCVHGSRVASTLVSVESILHTRILKSYDKVDRIVVPSQFFIRKFVEWGWNPARFTYIPNYVETSRLVPEYRPGSYFLYLGRLSGEKGLTTLIRATAASGSTLKIAGTGPMDDELRALATKLDADVEFVGFRSGAALHDLIRGSRATVIPSEWYENAPLSVLESLALGKPVIGADIGGIPEMIVPDRSGWLFPSGNVEALAESMSDVANLSEHEMQMLGASARNFVDTKFSKNTYRENFERLYQELSSSSPIGEAGTARTVM